MEQLFKAVKIVGYENKLQVVIWSKNILASQYSILYAFLKRAIWLGDENLHING